MLCLHPNAKGRAVIFSPGRGGGLSQGDRFLPLFEPYGCHVLMLQQRGAGESTKTPLTYGYHEKHDLDKAVDWLADRVDCDPSRIGLVGISYGAAVSLQTLRLRDDLAFVIADSTFSDLR